MQPIEEAVRIAIDGAWIEQDDFVAAGVVVALVFGEEVIGTEIRVHGADAINEDIRMNVFIRFVDFLVDALLDIAHKLLTSCLDGEDARVFRRFVLQHIMKIGAVELAKGLLIEETAELIEEIEGWNIDEVGRPFEAVLHVVDLLTDFVFLGRVIKENIVVVVNDIARVLERLGSELFAKLWDGHWCHRAAFLMDSIS